MKNFHETVYRAILMTRRRFQFSLLLVISAAVSIFGGGRAQAIIWNGTDSNYVRMGQFSQYIKNIVWGLGKTYQSAQGIAGRFIATFIPRPPYLNY